VRLRGKVIDKIWTNCPKRILNGIGVDEIDLMESEAASDLLLEPEAISGISEFVKANDFSVTPCKQPINQRTTYKSCPSCDNDAPNHVDKLPL
jgi:hypothetical protein